MKVLGTSGWVDDMLCEREMIGKLNCGTEEYGQTSIFVLLCDCTKSEYFNFIIMLKLNSQDLLVELP